MSLRARQALRDLAPLVVCKEHTMSTSQAVIVVGIDGSSSATQALTGPSTRPTQNTVDLPSCTLSDIPRRPGTTSASPTRQLCSRPWSTRVSESSTWPRLGRRPRERVPSRRCSVPRSAFPPRPALHHGAIVVLVPAVADQCRACCSVRSARPLPGMPCAPWSSTGPHTTASCATASSWPLTPARSPGRPGVRLPPCVRTPPATHVMHCHGTSRHGPGEQDLPTADLEAERLDLAISMPAW